MDTRAIVQVFHSKRDAYNRTHYAAVVTDLSTGRTISGTIDSIGALEAGLAQAYGYAPGSWLLHIHELSPRMYRKWEQTLLVHLGGSPESIATVLKQITTTGGNKA